MVVALWVGIVGWGWWVGIVGWLGTHAPPYTMTLVFANDEELFDNFFDVMSAEETCIDVTKDKVFVFPFFDPTCEETLLLACKMQDLSLQEYENLARVTLHAQRDFLDANLKPGVLNVLQTGHQYVAVADQVFTKHNIVNTGRAFTVRKMENNYGQELRYNPCYCLQPLANQTTKVFVRPFLPSFMVISGWVCPPQQVKLNIDRTTLYVYFGSTDWNVVGMTLDLYDSVYGDCAACSSDTADMIAMLNIIKRRPAEDWKLWCMYVHKK